ncbi:hypothetical protein ACJ41O_006572 [Fusarium nematophilum]
MTATRDDEGLQVDYDRDRAARAPEAAAPYDQNNSHFTLGGQYTAIAAKDEQYNSANHIIAQQQKVPFGLSILNFGILVAVVTTAIVGGGIGGGLGAALAKCNNSESSEAPSGLNKCDQSDSSNDPNDYAPIPAAQVRNLTLNCPENGPNGTLRTENGYRFHSYCGVNAPETGDGNINDIVSIWAYYFDDCIGACAEMTKNNETVCDSVFFRSNMNVSTAQYGNCWLKSGKLKSGDSAWTQYQSGRVYAEMDDSD